MLTTFLIPKERIYVRTNNGLERYNRELKSLFKNTTPSLICFVETLEKESRQQVQNLDNICKGLVVPSSRKRKRDEDPKRNEFNTPSIHYLEFVKNQKLNNDLHVVLKIKIIIYTS